MADWTQDTRNRLEATWDAEKEWLEKALAQWPMDGWPSSVAFGDHMCRAVTAALSALDRRAERIAELEQSHEVVMIANDAGTELLSRAKQRIARMKKAGNALADAAMVCPEDVEEQREIWREACAE